MFYLIGRTKFGFQYAVECLHLVNETVPTKVLASNISPLYFCIYVRYWIPSNVNMIRSIR